MLKRRPSKRFVLAETGEETAWNTTTDNDTVATIPQIDIGLVNDAILDQEKVPITEIQQTNQLLTVPQPIKSGMK